MSELIFHISYHFRLTFDHISALQDPTFSNICIHFLTSWYIILHFGHRITLLYITLHHIHYITKYFIRDITSHHIEWRLIIFHYITSHHNLLHYNISWMPTSSWCCSPISPLLFTRYANNYMCGQSIKKARVKLENNIMKKMLLS